LEVEVGLEKDLEVKKDGNERVGCIVELVGMEEEIDGMEFVRAIVGID
jgi:hypothetical protein